MDLNALKAELESGHPDTGPYSADDATAATELNVINRTKEVDSIAGSKIFNAIDPDEFDALTNAVKDHVKTVCMLGDSIDIKTGTNTRKILLRAFGAGSATRTNLIAVGTTPASRADELGFGSVTPSDVANARRLP